MITIDRAILNNPSARGSSITIRGYINPAPTELTESVLLWTDVYIKTAGSPDGLPGAWSKVELRVAENSLDRQQRVPGSLSFEFTVSQSLTVSRLFPVGDLNCKVQVREIGRFVKDGGEPIRSPLDPINSNELLLRS